MEKIETILTNCISEIKSGKATIAKCLDRYPSRRQELEPLLKMALNIQEPPSLQLDMSYKQAAKARLLQQIRASKQKKSRPFTDLFSFGLPQQYVWARIAISVLVVVIVMSMLAGGTAYAARGSLPGDFLYPVKIGTEDARLLIAGDSSAKAELNLEFAQTRLVEMSKLATRDEEKTELAVNGYRRSLDAARQQIRGISDASTLSDLLNHALEDVQKQTVFCDNAVDANPAYLGPVNEASTLAINGQVELLEMLAQRNILQAARINLDAMQNRLQRAQLKATGNQYQTMKEVLLQYQQFNQLGEQILQSAQASNNYNTEIEALSLQALSSYLDTLNGIAQEVPQEYQNTIEVCRQMTLQFQTQARYRYQRQGDSGPGPQSQTPGNSGGSITGQGGQPTPQYQGGTGNTGNETSNPTTAPSSEATGNTGSGAGTGFGSGTNSGGEGIGGTTSDAGTTGLTGGQKP